MNQPTYQQGYINGYLEGLLAFYNLRYKRANDYRNVEARFIQTPFIDDLERSILAGLADHYRRSSSFQEDKVTLFGDSLQLKPLDLTFSRLSTLLEPWLPNEEEKIIAKEYEVPEDQLPAGGRLVDNFLDFVLKDYGLNTSHYHYWEAIFPNALMKTFSYCTDEMFTLVIENGREVNMLHFARKVIYP